MQRDVGCTPTACLHHFPGSPASSQVRGGGRGIGSRVLQHPLESCRQSPDVCTAQASQGRVAVRRSPGRTQHPFGGWPAPCPWTQALSWVLREAIPSAGILCALRCWGHPGQEESCLPRRAGCGTHGGPLQIPAAGPLFSNWGHSQGGHSRAEPRARPAQGSGETARGVLGGVWRQEHERDRQAREGHEGALPGAWGRPARVCRKEAGGTGWGPEPLIPRACDPRRLLGREWRKLESGVEESRPVSWEAGSCPPPPGPCRSGGPLTPHFPGELHMPRCHMGSKAMPVGSHHAGPLGLLVK